MQVKGFTDVFVAINMKTLCILQLKGKIREKKRFQDVLQNNTQSLIMVEFFTKFVSVCSL